MLAAITQVCARLVRTGLQACGVDLRGSIAPRQLLRPWPFQLYLTVRLGLKLDPLAVAVTGSPAKTSFGCTEQAALAGIPGAPPPNIKLRPVCSLRPRISVFGTDGGPYE